MIDHYGINFYVLECLAYKKKQGQGLPIRT